jgi:phosphinothricin acetyltransferase
VNIRDASLEDAQAITAIYNRYILNTPITFEEQPLSVVDMKNKIAEITKHFPWLVAIESGEVLGYAYSTKFRERSAYRFSIETSVYCAEAHTNEGVGTRLYTELLRRVKELGLKVAYGCIALPNEPSVKLHEKLGFKKVAHLSEVGFKLGKWIDVGYWELKLN